MLPATGWQLTWSDEFDGPAGNIADEAKWSYRFGNETADVGLQFYPGPSPRNASMDGVGNLVITARQETLPGASCWYGPCQYTSAWIRTTGKFSQAYGRFEARIQVPAAGRGLRSAFWMIGDDPDNVALPTYGGAIDVMRILGEEPRQVYGYLTGPGYFVTNVYTLPPGQKSFANEFHTFAVEWEPNVVRWYVDDQLYQTRTPADLPPGTTWVYDHPFSIILNLRVGGAFGAGLDPTTKFPAQMKIDYVRVYKRA